MDKGLFIYFCFSSVGVPHTHHERRRALVPTLEIFVNQLTQSGETCRTLLVVLTVVSAIYPICSLVWPRHKAQGVPHEPRASLVPSTQALSNPNPINGMAAFDHLASLRCFQRA